MTKYIATEEEYRSAAAASKSLAQMARNLGIPAKGGNYQTLKRKIAVYSIDISHFTGQAWNKNNFSNNPQQKIAIKKKLIRERGHQCERCKRMTWLGEPITLEMEHIDGNNQNNDELNLLLLCPNCHSFTPTWRSKNRKEDLCECGKNKFTRQHHCEECKETKRQEKTRSVATRYCACGEPITPEAKQCAKCYQRRQERIQWPTLEELRIMLAASNYSAVARQLGVSDNAVRKRLVNHSTSVNSVQ